MSGCALICPSTRCLATSTSRPDAA
jgi:hypothetical protein